MLSYTPTQETGQTLTLVKVVSYLLFRSDELGYSLMTMTILERPPPRLFSADGEEGDGFAPSNIKPKPKNECCAFYFCDFFQYFFFLDFPTPQNRGPHHTAKPGSIQLGRGRAIHPHFSSTKQRSRRDERERERASTAAAVCSKPAYYARTSVQCVCLIVPRTNRQQGIITYNRSLPIIEGGSSCIVFAVQPRG